MLFKIVVGFLISVCPIRNVDRMDDCVNYWVQCMDTNDDEEFCWENMPEEIYSLYD